MPLPETKDVGEVIAFLKKENPGMGRKQMMAIALNRVRKYGSHIKVSDMVKRGGRKQ